jgi:hypothetical protein
VQPREFEAVPTSRFQELAARRAERAERARSAPPRATDALSLGTASLASRVFKPGRPLFIVAIAAGVLIVTAIVVFFVLQIGTVTFSEPVYRYENGVRFDYEGTTRLRREDDTFFLRNAGTESTIPGTPLYFEDSARLFVPGQMMYVDPANMRPLGRTGYNTFVQRTAQGTYVAEVNGSDVELTEGFLFDGQNTYVFLEPMTVMWGDKKIEVEPYSCAIVLYGLHVELYPAGGGSAEIIVEQNDFDVSAVAKGKYTIDLSKDILRTEEGDLLLFSQPSLLEFLS